MAAGSVSLLSDYTTIVSVANVTYTIYNFVPHTYTKTVDKAYTDIGKLLTYTVVIDNPNDIPVANAHG